MLRSRRRVALDRPERINKRAAHIRNGVARLHLRPLRRHFGRRFVNLGAARGPRGYRKGGAGRRAAAAADDGGGGRAGRARAQEARAGGPAPVQPEAKNHRPLGHRRAPAGLGRRTDDERAHATQQEEEREGRTGAGGAAAVDGGQSDKAGEKNVTEDRPVRRGREAVRPGRGSRGTTAVAGRGVEPRDFRVSRRGGTARASKRRRDAAVGERTGRGRAARARGCGRRDRRYGAALGRRPPPEG